MNWCSTPRNGPIGHRRDVVWEDADDERKERAAHCRLATCTLAAAACGGSAGGTRLASGYWLTGQGPNRGDACGDQAGVFGGLGHCPRCEIARCYSPDGCTPTGWHVAEVAQLGAPPASARYRRGSTGLVRSWLSWSGDGWVRLLVPDSCRFCERAGRVTGRGAPAQRRRRRP